MLQHILLALLWILYGLLHSLMAAMPLKNYLRQKLKGNYKYYRLFYTLCAFVSLAALLFFQIRMETLPVFQKNFVTDVAGIVLGGAGLLLMAVCIRKYFFSLSGLRSLFVENHTDQLIITGVHRFVRHPLYLGTFAFIWGLFLYLPLLSLLVGNVVITAYTLYGIELEEKKLLAGFGDDYRRYRETVPKILPSFRVKREFSRLSRRK